MQHLLLEVHCLFKLLELQWLCELYPLHPHLCLQGWLLRNRRKHLSLLQLEMRHLQWLFYQLPNLHQHHPPGLFL